MIVIGGIYAGFILRTASGRRSYLVIASLVVGLIFVTTGFVGDHNDMVSQILLGAHTKDWYSTHPSVRNGVSRACGEVVVRVRHQIDCARVASLSQREHDEALSGHAERAWAKANACFL